MQTIVDVQSGKRKIYSILNDFVFQWLFNRPGQEKITCSLLNAILQLEGDRQIESVRLLNPFHPRRFREMKMSIVDVKAVDHRGHSYAVEAQVHRHNGYVERTALYVAGLYREQSLSGSAYVDVRPATCISILEFNLFENSEKLHEVFEFRNLDNTITLYNTMALHYIDLTKYDHNKPRILQSNFEKWLNVLKFSETYGILGSELPQEIKNPEIFMVVNELQKLNADEKMRRRMQDREQAALDLAIYRGAAYREGREDGKAEGKAEGIEEGLVKGRSKEREDMAIRMHSLAMTLDKIAAVTGLSEDQLKTLLEL